MEILTTVAAGCFIICTCVEEVETPIYGDVCEVCGYNRVTHEGGYGTKEIEYNGGKIIIPTSPCFETTRSPMFGAVGYNECQFSVTGYHAEWKVEQKAIRCNNPVEAAVLKDNAVRCKEILLEQEKALTDALKTHEKPRLVPL